MNKIKNAFALIGVIVVLGLVGSFGYNMFKGSNKEVVPDSKYIMTKINELYTADGIKDEGYKPFEDGRSVSLSDIPYLKDLAEGTCFEGIVNYELNAYGTTRSIDYYYSSEVKCGFDFDGYEPTIDTKNKQIIFDELHTVFTVDITKTSDYEEDNNLFNAIDGTYIDECTAEIEAIEINKAIEQGIVDTATDSLKDIVKDLYPDYEIVINDVVVDK